MVGTLTIIKEIVHFTLPWIARLALLKSACLFLTCIFRAVHLVASMDVASVSGSTPSARRARNKDRLMYSLGVVNCFAAARSTASGNANCTRRVIRCE
jgi:hypothetical protein